MIVICGKSATGKDTTYRQLLNDYPDLKGIVTYTTRKPRDNEQNGIDYHFITEEEFLTKINNQFFGEYRTYEKQNEGLVYYGSAIDDYIDNGVIILPPKGISIIKEKYPDIDLLTIMLGIPLNIQYARLMKRGNDTKEEIERRMKQDIIDFADFTPDYVYSTNHTSPRVLANTIHQIYDIHCKVNNSRS